MLHTHAPVFGPPRKHPPSDERAAEGPDAELPAAERASDAARTRNPLGGTSLIQVHRQTCPALAALQTTVAQPLSSSVAQPTLPSVARRSEQKKGRARVQKEGKPLPARRSASMAESELVSLVEQLTAQMHQAAADLQFELAARLRDEVSDLKTELRGMREATG